MNPKKHMSSTSNLIKFAIVIVVVTAIGVAISRSLGPTSGELPHWANYVVAGWAFCLLILTVGEFIARRKPKPERERLEKVMAVYTAIVFVLFFIGLLIAAWPRASDLGTVKPEPGYTHPRLRRCQGCYVPDSAYLL